MVQKKKALKQGTQLIALGFELVLPLVVGLFAWEGLSNLPRMAAFILPSPRLVATRLVDTPSDGTLARHLLVTLTEVLLGLLAGSFLATAFWAMRR